MKVILRVQQVMAKLGYAAIFVLLGSDVWVTIAFFSLQVYLTKVWGLSITHAAAILNVWSGIWMILPCFFLYLVDEFFGHFLMLILSSMAYCLGVGLIAISTPPALASLTGTCTQYRSECVGHTQKVLFYTGLAFLAVGKSGHSVSLLPFLEKQEQLRHSVADDDGINRSNIIITPLFQIWFISVTAVLVIVALFIPSISIPWSIQYGIAAACSFTGMLFFVSFSRANYIKQTRNDHCVHNRGGNPFTIVCRVFVACATKISRPFPRSVKLYRQESFQSFNRTRYLRCLEKAAMYSPEDDVNDRWKVCSGDEVEQAKIIVRMIPMWMTLIVCGIILSMEKTYFVEQENNMNRRIGKWNAPVQVPLVITMISREIIGTFVVQRIVELSLKTKDFVPSALSPGVRIPKIKRLGLTIGLGMLSSVLCCVTAAKVETMRLDVIRHHGLAERPGAYIPMTYYWLLFQFCLIAMVEMFLGNSLLFLSCYIAPEFMRSYLDCLRDGVLGVGHMLSVLSVYVVGRISERGGRPNWFQSTLNKSRLDKYYWVMAVLCSVNLLVYILVASQYRYTDMIAEEDVADDEETVNTDLHSPEENNGKLDG